MHSENPQDAADLWNGTSNAYTIFTEMTGSKTENTFPELHGYSYSIDRSAVKHIKNQHGNAQTEANRGQVAITEKDIQKIGDILRDYDDVAYEDIPGTNNRRFAFAKQFDDGLIVYLADSSKKRRDLRTVSMWKYPQSANAQDVLQHAVSLALTPEAEGGISHDSNSTPNADTNQDILYQGGADRGMFSREHNLIALLKNADASTFVHELGHFFLETNTRIARDLTAKPSENLTEQERQFLSDVQTTLDWFDVKDLAAWDAMSLNEQRENHEKWARGFEAYLYEGKAPSEELRGLFRRFRSWLKQVYHSLKNLNVKLTDEVRSVFDRMFAGDEQIQQTQYINDMTPLSDNKA